MTKLQFRVLYRQFLFRMVDLELLSPQGDIHQLLGQFAATLMFISSVMGLGHLFFDGRRMTPAAVTAVLWGSEHSMIAATMLVVGLFAILSWDSTFLDRRDVLVLAPLPVRTRTLFLAKVAASASAFGVTVAALNACTGITLPWILAPRNFTVFDLLFSTAFYRPLIAYWITMMSAGAFIFCSVMGVQGLAAQLLPRRRYLRLSSFLQMAAFCLFLSVYLLQPSLATPNVLSAAENQRLLAWLPSYWFLGLFEQLRGSVPVVLAPLARRAWAGLTIAVVCAVLTLLLSYFRTIRKIADEPDILPGARRPLWTPRLGNSLEAAILRFSLRTLLRSRQHRVMLAFYLGLGSAIVIAFMRTPLAHQQLLAAYAPWMFSSVVTMCVWVVGIRVVFAMPFALRANWIFRMTQIRGAPEYLAAIRRSLCALAVAPVWTAWAALFFSIWPWRPAASHLAVLGLCGLILALLCLRNFQKIPFTCSYLPGKSSFHMVFLAGLGLLNLLLKGIEIEWSAMGDPVRYVRMLLILVAVLAVVWWRTLSVAKSSGGEMRFEEAPEAVIFSLDLRPDGSPPLN